MSGISIAVSTITYTIVNYIMSRERSIRNEWT